MASTRLGASRPPAVPARHGPAPAAWAPARVVLPPRPPPCGRVDPAAQARDLTRLAAQRPAEAAHWAGRRRALTEHAATLRPPGPWRRAVAWLTRLRTALAARLLAAAYGSGILRGNARLAEDGAVAAALAAGTARRATFFTADHVQLDGLWVEGRRPQPAAKPRPVVVLACGCGGFYEARVREAETLAECLDATVLLFNYRGIGRSLGQLRRSADLVADAAAAIAAARRRGTGRLATLGFSVGASALTGALHAAQAAGTLEAADVAAHVCVHGMASLPDCAGGLAGRWLRLPGAARAVAWLAGVVARLVGLGTLPTARLLRGAPLARRTWVLGAADDEVMRGRGALGHALRSGPQGLTCADSGARLGHTDFAHLTAPDLAASPTVRALRAVWRAALHAP